MLGSHDIVQWIGRLRDEQVVAVVGHTRRLAERVPESVGQEEVLLGVGQLLLGCIALVRGEENSSRGHPPVLIALAVDVSAFALQHSVGDAGAIDLGHMFRRKRQLVALSGQRQRLELSER